MFSKLFKISVLSLIVSQASFAAVTIMYEKTVNLPVDISSTNVILSHAGYSMPMVKVLIPELAEVTFLNHRNNSAGAPCMSTEDANRADDVIQNNPAVENINFKIKLSKYTQADEVNKVCNVFLIETISATIRGFKFNHELFNELASRTLADCK